MKIFALFLYWTASLEGIQYLVNYPADTAVYAALFWFIMNIYITYYLITNKKLK